MDNVQYEVRYIVFETLYWSVFENLYYKSETGETKHMIKIAIVEDEAMYMQSSCRISCGSMRRRMGKPLTLRFIPTVIRSFININHSLISF